MVCSKCRHNLEGNFFCSNCGAFNIANGIFIQFSDSMLHYILIRAPYEKAAEKMRQQFTKYINQITSFDVLYSTGVDTFEDCMSGLIKDGVLDDLVDKGIYTYSAQMLAKEFADYSIGGSGYKSMKKFAEISEVYQLYANEINTKRNIQRSDRSYWEGGGFGLKGMLSGAITAGILNLGTEAIRGIGDAITDANDRKHIDSAMQKFFSTAQKSLIDALYFYICDMATFVYNILVREGVYYQIEFAKDEEVCIADENEISNKVQTVAYNVFKMYENNKCTKEQAISKICQCIAQYPFNYDPYAILYKIERSTKNGLIGLGDLCGMRDCIERQLYLIDIGKSFLD
ncbi:MAG: hypothetical protein NC253_03225 [Ruminococcus sp.]|nr:hypothetical protein [Ruminococcus sp.]MCM1480149.1 hypothetical protein [Muribaculaceae bacterium]